MRILRLDAYRRHCTLHPASSIHTAVDASRYSLLVSLDTDIIISSPAIAKGHSNQDFAEVLVKIDLSSLNIPRHETRQNTSGDNATNNKMRVKLGNKSS